MRIKADFNVDCFLNSDLSKSENKRPLKWVKKDDDYVVNVKASFYFTQDSYYEIYFENKKIQSANVEFKGVMSDNGVQTFIYYSAEDMELKFYDIKDLKINSLKLKGQNKVITSKDYDFEKDTELLQDLKNIILDECSLNFEVETISEVVYE